MKKVPYLSVELNKLNEVQYNRLNSCFKELVYQIEEVFTMQGTKTYIEELSIMYSAAVECGYDHNTLSDCHFTLRNVLQLITVANDMYNELRFNKEITENYKTN